MLKKCEHLTYTIGTVSLLCKCFPTRDVWLILNGVSFLGKCVCLCRCKKLILILVQTKQATSVACCEKEANQRQKMTRVWLKEANKQGLKMSCESWEEEGN